MIKADNTQKRCFVACDEQTRKDGKCTCFNNIYQASQLLQTNVSLQSKQLCPNCKVPMKLLYDKMACFKCMTHTP